MVPHGAGGDLMGPAATREERIEEHARLVRIAKASKRPVTYSLLQFNCDPQDWRLMVAASDAAHAAGLRIYPQTAARAAGALTTLEGYHPFMLRPSYMAIAHLPRAERAAAMRDPERRRAILTEANAPSDEAPDSTAALIVASTNALLPNLYLMSEPIDWEPGPEKMLKAVAARSGKRLEEQLYDHMSADDGRQFASTLATNYENGDLEVAREMLSNPHVLSSLSDAGAHVRFICDGALPTFQLMFWCRDRTRGPKFPLEFMVRKATRDAAALYDLKDRGKIAPGKRADINVIDFDRLTLDMPHMAYDMPSGGGRLLQKSRGYLATLVAGEVTRQDDQDTGARPGRLLRSRVA
jgi:N-acyl-D-aspartate/D-glutamate deacylase